MGVDSIFSQSLIWAVEIRVFKKSREAQFDNNDITWRLLAEFLFDKIKIAYHNWHFIITLEI